MRTERDGTSRDEWEAKKQAEHDRAFAVAQGVGETPPWALTFMCLYVQPSRPTVEGVLADWPAEAGPPPTADEARDLIAHLKTILPARPAPRRLRPFPAVTPRPFLDARSEPAA
jgi:hypothetical protein